MRKISRKRERERDKRQAQIAPAKEENIAREKAGNEEWNSAKKRTQKKMKK